MALRWIANNTSRVMHIGGQMVLPGAGAFVDEPTPRSTDPSGTLDDTGYIVKGLPVIGGTLSVAFLPGYYPTASSTYAWFRSNILGALPIAGATGPTYLLTSQDDGFTVFPFVTNVAYSRIGVMVGQPAPEPAAPPPSSPPPLTITASLPGTATVGTAYSGSVAASGGTAPYTYSVFAGTLPAGLSINASTGAVTGTPSAAATTSGLVFRVTDSAGATANTAAQSITVAASGGVVGLAIGDRIVWEGDSHTASSSGEGYQFWALGESGGRLYSSSNDMLAVGGQQAGPTSGPVTTAETEHPSQIAAVLARNPDVVHLWIGFNDIGSGRTAAATYASIMTCVNGYLADTSIKLVYVGTITPVHPNGPTPLDAPREAARVALNDMLRALSMSRVKVVDYAALPFDLTPTSVHHKPDGGHLTMAGHSLVGKLLAADLNTRLTGEVLSLAADVSNMLIGAGANPGLTGVAGGKTAGTGPAPTGEVADSWSLQGNVAGVIPVAAKTTLNGAVAQQITVNGTSTAAGTNVRFQTGIITYDGQIGDGYEAWCDIELASGAVNVTGLVINIDTATTWAPGSTTPIPGDAAVSMVLRTKLTAPLAAADTAMQWRFNINFGPAGPVNALVKIGRPYLRKISGVLTVGALMLGNDILMLGNNMIGLI